VHGGGNVSGSASEPELRGAWLARQTGAVVATFDYRLGALGYLSHPSLAVEDAHGSSGNYGLLDQIAALEWLQRNAAALGADPTRMVAFGQSAGSRNLCAIAGSPLATKLLSGVILQSGACNLRDLSAKYAFGQDVARETGCGTAADVAGCLRAVPPDVLAKARPSLPNPMTISQYNPAVDGWSIVDEPLARLRSGAHGIPVIVGSNAEEVGNVMPWIESETQYVTLVEALFGRELAPIVLSSYPAADYPSPRDALVAAVTEARYTCPALATADAAAEGGSAYLYVFSQGLAGGPEATFGAYHGLELLFLFGAFDARGYHANTEERALAVELAGFYGRFAQIGDPQAFATAGVPRWPLYTASEQPFLRLTTPLTPDARPAARRCEIWQGAE
jgi:para-nitrobenzyl esterase